MEEKSLGGTKWSVEETGEECRGGKGGKERKREKREDEEECNGREIMEWNKKRSVGKRIGGG